MVLVRVVQAEPLVVLHDPRREVAAVVLVVAWKLHLFIVDAKLNTVTYGVETWTGPPIYHATRPSHLQRCSWNA